jgi:hypothetical protein
MLGKHMIKSYSKQQQMLAFSSTEAETYGMVACSAELLGIQSCARDMGFFYDGTIYADASAALGIVQRRGIGKVRHIRTQSLWLQEAHATQRLGFEKIDGSRSPSDHMTKHLTDTLQRRLHVYINAVPTGGRAETAPALSNLEVEDDRYYLGRIHEEVIPSILKVYEREFGTGNGIWLVRCSNAHCRYFGTSDAPASDAPAPRNAANSAARVSRRKSVRFSPLVSLCNVTPHTLVYGMHPREFDFDERGRMVSRQCSHRAPHSREIKIREAPAILSRLSSTLLPLDGSRSQELECKLMTDGSGRKERREREVPGWLAGDRSISCTD